MPKTHEILRELVAFPTLSRTSNLALVDYAQSHLEALGAQCTRVTSADGRAANLFATIGPADVSGVLLSGHTDVVPVEGQDWQLPPFELTTRDGRYYGRGTADMKGFVAAALHAAARAAGRDLRAPLHLALSYDEEIGCVGVRSLLDTLEQSAFRPRLCIVGEPTGMGVATGHKGKTAMRARCRGVEAHSALAPTGLNAIHLAAEFIALLREVQDEIVAAAVVDDDYDVPYSTVHAGTIHGGVALNIVPNLCEIDFEVRNLREDDPAAIIARIRAGAESIASASRVNFEAAAIDIEILNAYPGLATPAEASAVAFVKSLTGANSSFKVAFGTEGGLFAQQLEVPVVVCGPGSMAQGHKPDEFVSAEQLARCDAMLDQLLDRLEAGL